MVHSDKPESTRSSGKQIEIQIGDEVFVADLLDKKAPRTCAAFLSILPHEGVTYHQFWSGSGLQVHDPTLKKMAEETGGRAYFPDKLDELRGVYEEIALELKNQYYLTYEPTNTTWDGRWRKIKLTAPGKSVDIRTRRGYYAVRKRSIPGISGG